MIFLFIHSGSNLLASISLLIQWALTRCRGLYWFLGATWNLSGGSNLSVLRGWDAIPSACCTPACWFLSHSRLHSSMVMTVALVWLHCYW